MFLPRNVCVAADGKVTPKNLLFPVPAYQATQQATQPGIDDLMSRRWKLKASIDDNDLVTVDGSNVGKVTLSSEAMALAINNLEPPYKGYTPYLYRRVMVALHTTELDMGYVWGFARLNKDGNRVFIQSPNDHYDFLYLLVLTHPQQPEIAVSLRAHKVDKLIRERNRTLLFKAPPPVLLQALNLTVMKASSLTDGVLRKPLPLHKYNEIAKTYSGLIEAYDLWQRSVQALLTTGGDEHVGKHVMRQEAFRDYLVLEARNKDEYKTLLKGYDVLQGYGEQNNTVRAALSVGYSRETMEVIRHENSQVMDDALVHLDPAYNTVTQVHTKDISHIASSPNGNVKTITVFKDDVRVRLGVMLDTLQNQHGFVVLASAQQAGSFAFTNKTGKVINYIDACNSTGSLLVSAFLVFAKDAVGDHLPHTAVVTIIRVVDDKEKAILAKRYAYYQRQNKASLHEAQEATLNEVTDSVEHTLEEPRLEEPQLEEPQLEEPQLEDQAEPELEEPQLEEEQAEPETTLLDDEPELEDESESEPLVADPQAEPESEPEPDLGSDDYLFDDALLAEEPDLEGSKTGEGEDEDDYALNLEPVDRDPELDLDHDPESDLDPAGDLAWEESGDQEPDPDDSDIDYMSLLSSATGLAHIGSKR